MTDSVNGYVIFSTTVFIDGTLLKRDKFKKINI